MTKSDAARAREYLAAHPEATVAEAARALGMSRQAVHASRSRGAVPGRAATAHPKHLAVPVGGSGLPVAVYARVRQLAAEQGRPVRELVIEAVVGRYGGVDWAAHVEQITLPPDAARKLREIVEAPLEPSAKLRQAMRRARKQRSRK